MLWDAPGIENTEGTLRAALQKAQENDINWMVVASNEGDTVRSLLGLRPTNTSIVCVTHEVGYRDPGVDEMSRETRRFLEAHGVKILTTTHLFAGVERAVRMGFGGLYPAEVIAETLKFFGAGMKVCVEISTMAVDSGLIPYGSEIIAIAGTVRGADTAIVIRPSHATDIFSTEILEIICRPRCRRVSR